MIDGRGVPSSVQKNTIKLKGMRGRLSRLGGFLAAKRSPNCAANRPSFLWLTQRRADGSLAGRGSPNLRTPTDENYDGVGRVLDGDQSLIHSLHLEPGDLQIFKGRYSLHRVTPLSGPTMRYVAIFSFTEMEGVVGSPERTKQLYGRVLPIHLERAGMRGDALVD